MIISHDLGTTGDKATLVSNDGTLVAAVTATYPTDFGPRGKAEQDAEHWWTGLCTATKSLLDHAAVRPEHIDVVSFSGQMMGAVLLDAAGDPVRPAIIWADTRSGAQCSTLIERVGMARGYAITGHRLNPTYSLSKIMWVRDQEEAAYRRAMAILLAKDFVAYRLTGVIATDPSDASSTNAYDQQTGGWSEELIEAANLSPSLFPEIVPSTAVVGRVTAAAAAQSGLLTGTPVVMGGGDGPMAALGAGIVGPESGAYAYLGSSSWVSMASHAPLHDPAMRSMTFNHVIPERYVPTATMQAGGASLEWIIETLAADPAEGYRRLLEQAADVVAAEDGLYFLPYLLGERSPYWNPAARAVFAGMGRHHGPAHLTRAVLEGIAFNLYACVLAFLENGTSIPAVHAIGGAARSDLLLQIFSDVWGLPVSRRNLVDEATAIGAAIVGGIGVGIFDGFDVAARFSHQVATMDPDPERHQQYLGEFQLFLEAYRRLEPWFDKI
jgi:xylulokinase